MWYIDKKISNRTKVNGKMPIELVVKSGKCQGGHHKKGDRFVVDWETPGGFCLGAWNAISPYVTALLCGGNFPWESEPGRAEIHCPDPKGITLEIRRVEEKD